MLKQLNVIFHDLAVERVIVGPVAPGGMQWSRWVKTVRKRADCTESWLPRHEGSLVGQTNPSEGQQSSYTNETSMIPFLAR